MNTLVIEILDIENENNYMDWEFKINSEGYIDMRIDGKYMDTWYEHGIVKNDIELTKVVTSCVSNWDVETKEIYFK